MVLIKMLRAQKLGKATHKWSDKSRIILLILKSFYCRKDTTAIWNHVFRDRLSAEGFRGGIPPTRLDGQFQEVKNGGKGFHFYTQIHDATAAEIKALFPAYWTEIQKAARTLKIDMAHNDTRVNTAANRSIARRRRGQAQGRVSLRQEVGVDNQQNASSINIRPNLQNFAYQHSPYFNVDQNILSSSNSAMMAASSQETVSSSSTDEAVIRSPRTPLVLFRATPDIAAFRSRMYKDANVPIEPPPAFGTHEFREIVWPHLQRDRAYDRSPFISLAQNPHNALRRVELARSEQIDQKMFLVIFGFQDLVQDGIDQFGTLAGPYLVRSLFTTQEISDLPDGYKGAGEVCSVYWCMTYTNINSSLYMVPYCVSQLLY